jgi:Protein of unknown function (DUF2971)
VDKEEYWKILSYPDRRFIDLRRVEALLCDAPKSLYKYCPASVEAITNFASGQIWLECPNKFNDPLDTVFNSSGFTLFKEPAPIPSDGPFVDVGDEFDAWENEWGFSDTWRLNETRDKVLMIGPHSFRDMVVVSCFSEIAPEEGILSTLMWSHYASSHKGFCLEYDLQGMRKGLFPVFPIHYADSFFDVAPLQWRSATQNYLDQSSDKHFNRFISVIVAAHKLRYWEYEREWRYILPTAPHARKVPIVSVTAGCDCSTELMHLLHELANARGIRIYQMVRAMRDGFTSLTRTEITRVEKKHIRGFGDPKV